MSPLEIGLLVAAVLFLVVCGVAGLVIVFVGSRRKQASAVAPLRPFGPAPGSPAVPPASLDGLLSGLDADLKAAAEKERHVKAMLKLHKVAYAKDEAEAPKS